MDVFYCNKFYNKSPSEILKLYLPTKYKNHAWIPQTIGEQIWIVYEFETIYDRLTWENSLPQSIANFLDRNLIKEALKYGWGVLDLNGFRIKK